MRMRTMLPTWVRQREMLLLQLFWISFQACSCFRIMTTCFGPRLDHDAYSATRYRRRQQPEGSVLVNRRMPFGLQATESSSSSSTTGENMNHMNNDASAAFDQETHLRILNDNLQRFSGKSLLHHMKDAEKGDDVKDDSNNSSGGDSKRTIGGMMEAVVSQEDSTTDASNASTSNDKGDKSDDDKVSWSPDTVHLSLRFALLSHGAVNGMDGPVNNYANFAALSAFSYTRPQMLRIPACRLAAPGSEQADLSQLYMTLLPQPQEQNEARLGTSTNNIMENHQAFYCTQYLQRFFIRNAIVWNCFDDDGEYYGQALFFDRNKVTFMDDTI